MLFGLFEFVLIMSEINSVPRTRRSKSTIHNYANLSKRGLQSLNPVRVKARVKSAKSVKKKQGMASPASSSGDWRVELLDKHDKQEGLPLPVNSDSHGKHDKGLNGDRVAQMGSRGEGPVLEHKGPGNSTVTRDLNKQNVDGGLCLEFQKSMSLEEKKRAVRESIAQLQQQVTQQQEDEELRALLDEERKLREQLAGNGTTQANKGNVVKNSARQGSSDMLVTLQNLTGVTFDMSGFVDDNRPKIKNVDDLSFVETPKKKKNKAKKSKISPEIVRPEEDSDVEMSESDVTSSDDDSDSGAARRKDPRKGNVRSGRYDRLSDTKLVSNEWYAHTAIDETIGGDKQFNELTFNLLVAGELEIISSGKISSKEKFSRIELLKILAYRHEVIPVSLVLTHYAGFLSKIEKGKYKWGSQKDLNTFEQQLVYSVSMDRSQVDKDKEGTGGMSKVVQGGKEEKKKYCLEYNKGECTLSSPHEGTLGNQKVLKYHLCKKCLMDRNLERSHPSKDCVRK